MIKSMTAFGNAEKSAENGSLVVEIRCVNRRYSEISVRLPQELSPLEDRVKKLAATRILRGRADITIKQVKRSDAGFKIEVNLPLARSYYDSLCRLKDELGIKDDVGLGLLLQLNGVVASTEPDVDVEKSWLCLSACVSDALERLDVMRAAEGQAMYADFKERLKTVDERISKIKNLAPAVVVECRDRLKERISVLMEGKVELDPNRLAQEAAFLADKSDINEEIVRLESHVSQFRNILESDGAVGRALDFLLQELNREINTIGSKTSDVQISHLVVDMKSELEKIREQIQNVE